MNSLEIFLLVLGCISFIEYTAFGFLKIRSYSVNAPLNRVIALYFFVFASSIIMNIFSAVITPINSVVGIFLFKVTDVLAVLAFGIMAYLYICIYKGLATLSGVFRILFFLIFGVVALGIIIIGEIAPIERSFIQIDIPRGLYMLVCAFAIIAFLSVVFAKIIPGFRDPYIKRRFIIFNSGVLLSIAVFIIVQLMYMGHIPIEFVSFVYAVGIPLSGLLLYLGIIRKRTEQDKSG